ncbi:MAG TPA: hypothetical protein VKA74_01550, partial [Myxococcota bacterium]|nr:hypothetical protein [Myxococcota bacterium]
MISTRRRSSVKADVPAPSSFASAEEVGANASEGVSEGVGAGVGEDVSDSGSEPVGVPPSIGICQPSG